MNGGSRDELVSYLEESGQFKAMPAKMQEWILESPNATRDFADFFRRSGEIESNPDARLPYFKEGQLPKIVVERDAWDSLQTPDAPVWPQRHIFGTLTHEIGHDRFNTGSIPFTGRTADDYVQYRSGLEAQAIFNAFPIFRDLETLPEFKDSKPFGSIGYVNEVELGRLYGDWKAGKIDDARAVEQIASKVADAPYTLNGSVQDQDGDGNLTHRDNYLQDFKLYIEPKLEPQSSVGVPASPTDPVHPDSGMLVSIRDGVQKIDTSLGKPFDEMSERMSRFTLVACKETGLHHVDHVVMGKNSENLFAVQGELRDPAHLRAHVSVEEAIRTPVEQSDEGLLAVNQSIAQQELARQQALTKGPDDPSHAGPVMS